MDFKTEFQLVDKEKNIICMKLISDPTRYEERTINNEEGYYDKYDNFFIPKKVLTEAAKALAGKPVYSPAPSIQDLNEYFARRKNES